MTDTADTAKFDSRVHWTDVHITNFLETNPDTIILTRLHDGVIIEVNDGFSRNSGYSRDEAIGRSTTDLGIWLDTQQRDLFVRLLQEQGRTLNFEAKLRAKDGRRATSLLSAQVVEHRGEQCIFSISRNITKLTEVQESLKQQTSELERINSQLQEKARLLSAFEEIGRVTLSYLDSDGLLDSLATEITKAGIFRSLMVALVNEEDRTVSVVRSMTRARRGGGMLDQPVISRPDPAGISYSLDDSNITAEVARCGEMQVIDGWDERYDRSLSAPDEYANVVAYFIPVKSGDRVLAVLGTASRSSEKDETLSNIELMRPLIGQVAIAMEHARLFSEVQNSQQILERRVDERTTELRESEQRLRELSRRLVELQESERRDLARELHDEIGQQLTGLNLLIGTSKEAPDDVVKRNLDLAESRLNELIQQVRNISLDLRPAMLDDMGLKPALQWYIGRFEQQSSISVACSLPEIEGRLPENVEWTAFRVVQEALTNVARHSESDWVAIEIKVGNGLMHISVKDGGVGFEVENEWGVGSCGIAGMRERVASIGGTLQIDSKRGIGVSVGAEIPLGIRSIQCR